MQKNSFGTIIDLTEIFVPILCIGQKRKKEEDEHGWFLKLAAQLTVFIFTVLFLSFRKMSANFSKQEEFPAICYLDSISKMRET